MLIINGLKYAKTDKEFTESLFQSDGTCSGFYKFSEAKGQIRLYDQHKKIFSLLICNWKQGIFAVSATINEDGKEYYFYGITDKTKIKLGMDLEKLTCQNNIIEDTFLQLGFERKNCKI